MMLLSLSGVLHSDFFLQWLIAAFLVVLCSFSWIWYLKHTLNTRNADLGRINDELSESVTELREANEKILEIQERDAIIYDKSVAGIWCYRMDPPIPFEKPDGLSEDEFINQIRKQVFLEKCNLTYAKFYNYESVDEVIGLNITHVGNRSETDINNVIRKWAQNGYKFPVVENLMSNVRGEEKWVVISGDSEIRDGKVYRSWGSIVDISDLKYAKLRLEKAYEEIQELNQRIEAENAMLQEELRASHLHKNILGQSEPMRAVLSQAESVARTNSTVLILGETGTGKELFARAIYDMSFYRSSPLVVVNCASIPSALVESELFGREKGAYTGAMTKRIGRFEIADGGTLFLDEIGELPLEIQAKLLRVLQEGEFERIGSNKTISVNVRVIAATNRDLAQMAREGKFREDLYYRLNVFPLKLPPLREREGDIEPLIWMIVKEFSERMGKQIQSISKADMKALKSYTWPGNVRELRNVIERAMIAARGKVLKVQIPKNTTSGVVSMESLDDVQRRHIVQVMKATNWKVRGDNGAAEILKMPPTTLEHRMQKLGIQRP